MARWGVVVCVAASPWLFGSSEPWAYLLVCMGVTASTVCWFLALVASPRLRVRVPAAVAALVLLGLFMALQARGWPLGVVEVLSPHAAAFARAQVERFAAAGVMDFLPADPEAAAPAAALSLAPGATRHSLWLFGAYLGVFLVVAHTTRRWCDLRRIAAVLAASTFALVVVSLVHKASGARDLLWLYQPRYMGNGFGPFTNRNHFAGHLVMAIGLVFGLFLASTADEIDSSGGRRLRGWRDRLRYLSRQEAGRHAVLAFVLAVFTATVFLTLSRGAIVSLAAAAGIATLLVALRHRGRRRRARSIFVAGALAAAVVVWLGWEPVVVRLGTLAGAVFDPTRDTRFLALRDTLVLLGFFPLFGAGFGAFQYVFPVVQSPDLQFGRWLHAHNDWAQLLAEGGVLGGVLALAAAVAIGRFVLTPRPAGNERLRLFRNGLMVGLVGAVLHGFVDYSLRKPSNALLLALLCGLAVAVTHILAHTPADRRTAGDAPGAEPDGERAAGSGYAPARRVRAAALAGLLLAVFAVAGQSEALRVELAGVRMRYAARALDLPMDAKPLEAAASEMDHEVEAVLRGPGAGPLVLRDAAATCFEAALHPDLPMPERVHLAERSVRCAALAVRAAPADYYGWIWLARAQAPLQRNEGVAVCLERARELRPGADTPLFPERD